MKNAFQAPTIFVLVTAAFASLSGIGSLPVRAQVREMDLLEPMLPARSAAAAPGGR
jgi:hypothetical protein